MGTKIGIISDVHARAEPLRQALELFEQNNVSDIICAGDIAGYYEELDACIALLKHFNCKTITGNHDEEFLQQHSASGGNKIDYLKSLPAFLELNIEQITIYVVHAQPPDELHGGIKLLDQQGDIVPSRTQHWENILSDFQHEILIVGHTHQVYALQLGTTFVINPGSSAFNHSCMILDLPDMNIQTYALENKEIIKCWNFSMLYGSGSHYPTQKKS